MPASSPPLPIDLGRHWEGGSDPRDCEIDGSVLGQRLEACMETLVEGSGLSLMSISNGFERREFAFELRELGFGLNGTLQVV